MKTPQQQTPHDEISPAEWVVAVLGALVVFALIAFLIYDALRDEHRPPQLEAAIVSIEQSGSAYLVEFRVHNDGDESAANVTIEAQLSDGGAPLETYTTTLDYVPAHSTRAGAALFQRDPAQFELEVHPAAYQNP